MEPGLRHPTAASPPRNSTSTQPGSAAAHEATACSSGSRSGSSGARSELAHSAEASQARAVPAAAPTAAGASPAAAGSTASQRRSGDDGARLLLRLATLQRAAAWSSKRAPGHRRSAMQGMEPAGAFPAPTALACTKTSQTSWCSAGIASFGAAARSRINRTLCAVAIAAADIARGAVLAATPLPPAATATVAGARTAAVATAAGTSDVSQP